MNDKSLDLWIDTLHLGWDMYLLNGTHEEFTEVAVELNGLTEYINRLKLPGLARECAELETEFLSRLGQKKDHPLGKELVRTLNRKLESLLSIIMLARKQDPASKNREYDPTQTVDWVRPRSIWMVAPKKSAWAKGLAEQLSFYGFRVHIAGWGMALPDDENPFAVIFLPASDSETADIVGRVALEQVARVRKRCPISQLFYVGVTHSLDSVVALMRAGIDITVQSDEQMATLLSRILDMVQLREQERYRILIVEDSKVAMTQIKKALTNQGLDTRSITSPTKLLEVMAEYQPDLVLMDMYMPTCNGVEATRVLRQMPAYQATPIVYLSGETNIGLQIEALRLGGDQFMTKPFNPILLAATLKTTIERHHEVRRASRHDGLTGLLNHTVARTQLDAWVAGKATGICIAMIDIDRFKAINNAYGYPAGDQVIRSLGWLLKGRMRVTDIVGRLGGDEFIIAARNTTIEEMQSVLDRIRSSFATMPHAHTGGVMHGTFSAGLAAYADFPDATQAIAAADEALLRAKREGRNRLLLAKTKKLK
jgi:diguanylate cyclase (GGDEF)-like protein